MELKINEFQTPEKILFNYEELKSMIQEKVQTYETLVYTDDQMKLAKADRASLNKLKTALNDERIRLEKEYMAEFNVFKAKINELISIIDKPVKMIDKQVKEFEKQKQTEKLEQVKEYFATLEKPEWLSFEQIVQERWGNASTSMRFIQDSIEGILNKIKNDLSTLQKLPEFSFEATAVYKTTLDLNRAVSEGQKLSEVAKRKAEHEAEQARLKAEAEKAMEESLHKISEAAKQAGTAVAEAVTKMAKIAEELPTEPLKQWVGFKALLSVDDALALKEFFETRNIEFEAI